MIIYNTTFICHPEVHEAVLEWIKRSYREAALSKGHASNPRLARILEGVAPDISYALHLEFADLEQAHTWDAGLASSLKALMHQRWGEKAVAFSTFMEVLE